MNNHKAVYRILRYLKTSESYDEFDNDNFTCEYFNLTERQFAATLERLIDDSYIKGVMVKFGADGYPAISISQPRITSRGLDYLEHDIRMLEQAKLAKGISETVS